MSDLLEQPTEMADSAAAENAGGGAGRQLAGEHDNDVNPFDDPDSQEQTGEEENEEIEVGDRKIALPKEVAERLKSERLMQADYTQKTQALAEERRQFQAHTVEQQQKQQQYVQEVAKVVAIDDQLAAYANLDWNTLIAQDPQQALIYQQQQRTLESQRSAALNSLTQKQQQAALAEQQGIAKQAQDAESYFTREIKGWSPERSTALQQYAVAEGINPQVLAKALLQSPALAKAVHKAEMYDQLVKKQPTKPASAPAKPAIKIGSSGASAVTDPSKMTDAQFAAWRRKQIQNRK